jgi:hypothetical protein
VNSGDKIAMLEAQVKSLTSESKEAKEKADTLETFIWGICDSTKDLDTAMEIDQLIVKLST